MARHSIARDVYGKPRSDDDDRQVGRKARARNLRVRRIEEVEFHSCGAPMGYCRCVERARKKPMHRDSVMEAAVYANPASRRTLYRAKGRLA